jgi:hypothetical protein
MKTTKQMKRKLAIAVLPILAAVSFSAFAAEAPASPPVMETYTCSYNAGKDMDDLMSARDYYVKQAAKAGIELPASYVWSLSKGDLPFDLVWLTPHANMVAFAEASDAEAASSDMSGIGARFDAVVNCTAGLGALTPVFGTPPSPEGAGQAALVSGSACSIKHGMGAAEVQDLRDHIAGVVGSLGDNAPNFMFTLSPVTSGPNSPDILLFTVNESLTSYAKFREDIRTSEGGAMLGRHFNTVLDCSLALWNSQRVIAPAE